MCVATITGRPIARQVRTARRWMIGELAERDLDAEVAARHHDDVGRADDVVEVVDRGLVLDLGDDFRRRLPVLEKKAEQLDVVGLADERQRDEIDAFLEADERVAAVLFGERREVHVHAGQVDVAARREMPRRQHAAADVGVVLLHHLEADQAVVDQDGVADLDVGDEIAVVDVDRADLDGVLAFRAGLDGEVEDLARPQLDGHREVAGADLGPLDVHHDRDVLAGADGGGPDAADDHARPVVAGVRHVEPHDVDAGVDDVDQHLLALRGGAERCDDLGPAEIR